MNNKFYIFIYKLHVYDVTSIRRCMLQLTIYYSSKKILTLGNTCVSLLINKGKKMFFFNLWKGFSELFILYDISAYNSPTSMQA